jgi:hypothetical protein
MKLDGLGRHVGALESRLPPVKSDMEEFLGKCTDEELRRLHVIIEKGYDDIDKLPPEDKAFLEIWRPDMGIVERLRRLEARVKGNKPSFDRN